MSRRLPAEFELKIEKISNNGEGVGFLGKKEIHIFGAYPGEIILAKPTKRKKRAWKAEIIEVKKALRKRRDPKESHYLSCGPWQTIDEKYQLKIKKDLVVKAFKNELSKQKKPNPKIIQSQEKLHYRNKMEFSFTELNGELRLALHKRYRHGLYSDLDSCCLAHEKVNKVADQVLQIIKNKKITKDKLKNLLIRYSIYENKCLVALYVTDKDFVKIDLDNADIKGWQIIYSDPQSPATVCTEILHKKGEDSILENIDNKILKYYYDSFFQINPQAFEEIVTYLKKNLKSNKTLVDLYSGVGTIGICLADLFTDIHSVEFDKKASEITNENAIKNNISNLKTYGGETEKQDLTSYLSKGDTLIVDPPRSGMHPKAVKQIMNIGPETFVYVSCNPYTQLRDMKEFSKIYKIKKWRLFDMYPQTPHLESVLMLKLK
ncbi:23S rRNA (uracil(1939)-C(5))-methyltransferase RlmD [Candidatus Parcubacteria bacterium]|nr:MAG: 23S rRNA (uracil(1939)-C(5))-methyltransferase RlmD [Candidatus Parcubacteria bacterium]